MKFGVYFLSLFYEKICVRIGTEMDARSTTQQLFDITLDMCFCQM